MNIKTDWKCECGEVCGGDSWNFEGIRECVTATLSVFSRRLGKSRACEVGHEVLCQIYAKGGMSGLWHGLNKSKRKFK